MLQGKTILILGSSRGIGLATAKKALEYGAKVILHGRKKTPQLISLAKELNASYAVFDATNKQAVSKEVQKLIKEGKIINGLVNCVGKVETSSFLKTTKDDWIKSFEVNTLSAVYTCQALIPHMLKHKTGSIVNIASIRGHLSGSHYTRTPYSTSKAAVINLSYTLAKEFAPTIRINSVSPGATNTDIAKNWTPEMRARHLDIPMKRIAEASEIAETVCFLLGDKASFITGQDFVVDGGYLLGKK